MAWPAARGPNRCPARTLTRSAVIPSARSGLDIVSTGVSGCLPRAGSVAWYSPVVDIAATWGLTHRELARSGYAYVGVSAHPFFAVTGDDGKFELPRLAPGKYTVEAWHERFGTKSVELTLEAGKPAVATFAFESK